jgi:PIN domain nuclease of toxin-antitoxin system
VKPVLADASAILAYLDFEPGGDVVEQYLADLQLTAVNLAEVVTVLSLRGVQKEWIDAHVLRGFANILPLDRDQATLAGSLAALTQEPGLSLGARACLAAGLALNARILTADTAWKKVKLGIEIVFIRAAA